MLQIEAERVANKIAELMAAKADTDAQMNTQQQLLASAGLLQNHPELKWEQVADQNTSPKLGVAQSLFVKDRRLSDFRCVICGCSGQGCACECHVKVVTGSGMI